MILLQWSVRIRQLDQAIDQALLQQSIDAVDTGGAMASAPLRKGKDQNNFIG